MFGVAEEIPSDQLANAGRKCYHFNLSSPSDSCWFLVWLILRPLRRRRYVTPKFRPTFIELRDVITQKIVATAMGILNSIHIFISIT
jgi:hypothetical protein